MPIGRGMDKEDKEVVMEHYSAIKKNEIMPLVATWMDLGISILSKVSQTEKEISYDTTYMQNLT